MDRRFYPEKERELLLSSIGIARQLRKSLEEERQYAALGSNANSMMRDAVQCFLVGFFDDGRMLLKKAHQWLQLAIEEKEIPRRYGKNACEASRLGDLFLCRWLFDSIHDESSAKQSLAYWKPWLVDHPNRKQDVTLLLPLYIDAEAYIEAVSLFDATRGLKPPQTARQMESQAGICYVIAKHRLGEDYLDVDLPTVIERFLKFNVGRLLAENAMDDVARWMKIAHWQPGLDPVSMLLKTYDYLIHCQPPEAVVSYTEA